MSSCRQLDREGCQVDDDRDKLAREASISTKDTGRMPVTQSQLLSELKALRRGLGVAAPAVKRQAGDALLAISKSGFDDGDDVVRLNLTNELGRLTEELPSELRTIARVSLNLDDQAGGGSLLQTRIEWLSRHLGRDARTVRRRIDEAMALLAEVAIKDFSWHTLEAQEASAEWYTRRCRTLLRIDLATPEALDEREIFVKSGELSSLSLPFTLPRNPGDQAETHDLDVEVLFGGSFVKKVRASDSRFDLKIHFPRTLERGASHRYALTYRIPPGQKMAPHYVFVPFQECEEFELRVRFNMNSVPRDIRKISAAFHREIEELQPDENQLETDGAGEVHVLFHELRPGFAYGVQWKF